MLIPGLPDNEAERLAALRALQILDTPEEERFDHVVRMAARLFDVPMAYISLIDEDRQWLKASCGLSITTTSREVSFCGHAILDGAPLVIPDTRADPRFADNPQVTEEPHIRFYAGHPLTLNGQYRVGTLCLADRRPRELHDRELQLLRDLAAIVERELSMIDIIHLQQELLATKTALEESQKHLAGELQEAADYVRSLLPAPVDGQISADWRFIPSAQLGGDALGYEWLDDDHFAMYVLDVCGHGVGSALLSISVLNVLRSQALPGTDFRDPAGVLNALNACFQMEKHGTCFTMWYGVYGKQERRIVYSSAGHPPALWMGGPGTDGHPAVRLGRPALMIGAFPETRYENLSHEVSGSGRLFLYSDGAYEIPDRDGSMLELDTLLRLLQQPGAPDSLFLDRVIGQLKEISGARTFPDDFSLLQVSWS